MSHVTVIDIEIKDIEALKEACKELGLEFREGQKTYRWYGRHVGDYPMPEGFTKEDLGKCNHAIGVPNNSKAYEVGVVQRGDSYQLLWDFWNGGYGLQQAVGDGCKNLTNKYAEKAAIRQANSFAKANGWSVSHEYNSETNETEITLRKY